MLEDFGSLLSKLLFRIFCTIGGLAGRSSGRVFRKDFFIPSQETESTLSDAMLDRAEQRDHQNRKERDQGHPQDWSGIHQVIKPSRIAEAQSHADQKDYRDQKLSDKCNAAIVI